MTIDTWWPRLRRETQDWLMENNGDAVPAATVEEVVAAGGPALSDSWWVEEEGLSGLRMPDAAIDWIEATANEEPTDG